MRRFRIQPRWPAWLRRIDRGKPALVKICGKLGIDVTADEGLKCMVNVCVLITGAIGPFLWKISVGNEVSSNALRPRRRPSIRY
jgi:hypothetical protein